MSSRSPVRRFSQLAWPPLAVIVIAGLVLALMNAVGSEAIPGIVSRHTPQAHRAGDAISEAAAGDSARGASHRVQVGFSPGFEIADASPADLDRELRGMKALGATQIRIDVSWALSEPARGTVDWQNTDRLITASRDAGLKVLGVLCYEPDWAARYDATGRRLPPDPQLFAAFAAAAAARYNTTVHAWEVWNEPNQARFWPSGPDPAAYAQLVDAAAVAIHGASSQARVAVGAMAPAPDAPDGSQLSPATFLAQMYDHVTSPSPFDAVSTHPYTYPAAPAGQQSWNAFHQLADLHQIMVSHGDGAMPMWLTEYGAPTGPGPTEVSGGRQAALLVQALGLARRLPYVTRLYYFSFLDRGIDPRDVEDNFGVVRQDGRRKPAYALLRLALGGHHRRG